jgi:DNA-binding NtrC family response regulator
MRILVADDEKIKRVTLADDLASQGHDVETAADGQEAFRWLEREVFDLVVTDMKMPKVDGIELLKRIKNGPLANVEVIVMTAYGSIPVAVEAMKLGAFDFVTKPFRNEDLYPLIARVAQQKHLAATQPPRTKDTRKTVDREVIGDSEAMTRVKRMLTICARTDTNVLLCGETGVGKDLLAQTIHAHSHRHAAPYVKVGCNLFPATLIESELYGHEAGSFTGADQPRKGRFELAEGGTIYLDDVDDIPLEQQAKLLRVIEEKVFERVGGTRPLKANVRIIASTKRNLLEQVAEGKFRQDLYYRLDVLRIRVPSLRDRREDIPGLTAHLLRRIARGQPCEVAQDTLATLSQHSWPGNVRELYHTLERAFLLGGGQITADALDLAQPAGREPTETPPQVLLTGGFQATMQFAEKQLLVNALEAAGGNKTAAAQTLGMKPSTFRDKLAKYGLK